MKFDPNPASQDVTETPLPDVLEALAKRIEEQAAAALEGLKAQAMKIRTETAATVTELRERAAQLRDEQSFGA